MALKIVLENYFENVLNLVNQSSDFCLMRFKVAGFFYLIFLWIIQIKQTFIAYDFEAIHKVWNIVIGKA